MSWEETTVPALRAGTVVTSQVRFRVGDRCEVHMRADGEGLPKLEAFRPTPDWLLRPAEAPDAQAHGVRLRQWVTSGACDDYAAVVIDPPLSPQESGVAETLARVVVAPRDAGVSLRSVHRYPVEVYVLTTAESLENATTIPPDALRIRLRGLLEKAR